MEYIDLHSGFALLGFDSYQEMQRVAQLCQEKYKPIAYKGDPARMQEILARHVVRADTYGGFMDYNHPLHAHFTMADSNSEPNRRGPLKGLESIRTAIAALEKKTGYRVEFIIICRK